MFFEKTQERIILRVRLTPNSSSCAVGETWADASGLEYLKINVISVPEKGKANQELIKLLAKNLKIAKSKISIISGETDRCKKLSINGEPEVLVLSLEGLRRSK